MAFESIVSLCGVKFHRIGVSSLAFACVGFLAVGCGKHPPEKPSEVAAASATPASLSPATTPDPSSDFDSDATPSSNGNGNVGNGNSGSADGRGSGLTINSDGGSTITTTSDGTNIKVPEGSTATISRQETVDDQQGGDSYTEIITTENGVTKKTSKRTDSNGNTTITTTTTDANGIVTSDGSALATHQAVNRVVSAAGVNRVDVRADYGAISIERAKGAAQVEIHADVSFGSGRISPADAKKFAARFTIAAILSDGALRVRVKAPADFPRGVGYTAAYHIGVPSGMSLNLDTSNGAVDVFGTGAAGTIAASSSYGSIQIENSGRAVDAKTSNGSVTVANGAPMTTISAHSDYGTLTIRADAGKVSATTSNGSVHITGARHARIVNARSDYGSIEIADCSGTIDAVSDNGSVKYDGTEGGTPTELSCTSDYGTVSATLGDVTALTQAKLTTDNGSVDFKTPASASLAITARTPNGSISTDGIPGPVTSDDSLGHSFDGRSNGGKIPVSLHTDYGSITIETR